MDKDQAKNRIGWAMQPMLPTDDILIAMLMGDVNKLDFYKKEVQRLLDKCAIYHAEIDACVSDEDIEAVISKVTRS